MALPKKPAAAPAPAGVNFGSADMYVAGGGLPEGDYVWTDLNVQIFEGFGAVKGKPRLGVMITMQSLNDLTADPRQQFYSMGGSADKSFAPNPVTGKGLVAVPGGPGLTLNNQTNWAILRQSLMDSGLPEGVFTDDVSVLEGIWVHMHNQPAPEERKGFGNKMAEVQDDRKGPDNIAVVSEIKEDGKPWDGTGGLPEAAPAVTKVAPKAAGPVKVAPKAAAKAAPVAAPVDEDVQSVAIAGVTSVLEKAENANGCPKVRLRTGTFAAIKASHGDDMAQAVAEEYFATDDSLNALLGQLGYVVKGLQVVPAS